MTERYVMLEKPCKHYTRNNLPIDPDWALYRKNMPLRALRSSTPFAVETQEGKVWCEDGYLAIDDDGYPFAIDKEAFEIAYSSVNNQPRIMSPKTEQRFMGPINQEEMAERTKKEEERAGLQESTGAY